MVITFLPYPDFTHSAQCLDSRRLLKQIVEAKQILAVISGEKQAWRNHPATKMWQGYPHTLQRYINAMILEAKARELNTSAQVIPTDDEPIPSWFGVDSLHKSHQSALMRKAPHQYSFPLEEEYLALGYVWPSDFPDRDIRKLSPHQACRPISDRQRNMKHCQALLKSGKRKDLPCNNGVYDGGDYCRTHRR